MLKTEKIDCKLMDFVDFRNAAVTTFTFSLRHNFEPCCGDGAIHSFIKPVS